MTDIKNTGITRGTTPDFLLTVRGWNLTDKSVYVTINQDDATIITKTNKDLDIVYENDVTSIYVTLSQEDTLALTEGTADIQARFIGANGKAPATKIKRIKINRVLLNKVITYGNNPT